MINRWSLQTLFGFHYKFEAYTPAKKRRYGAYVLPILRNGSLIGRLDPKLDRKAKRLNINGLWLEPEVRVSQALANDVAGALRSFAEFTGAEAISVRKTDPTLLKPMLTKAL